jgi:hypothetical protein
MRRAKSFGFAAAVTAHVAITSAWYVTRQHNAHLLTLAPWAGLFLCGLIVGIFETRATMVYAAILGLIMPIITSLIHLLAASIGAVEDARTPETAFLLSAILMPISVALSCAGGLLGGWLRKRP